MVVIATECLTRFIVQILESSGTDADIAECVADSVVGADLAGHPSHGVMKVPSYIRDIEHGKLTPRARPEIVSESPTTAVVDGHTSFGHLTARFTVDLAVEKARASGLAAVSASHTHHTGRLGGWSERIASAGMIGMLMGGEAQPPYKVVPHGGRTGALATNPVTWAVPRDDAPPVLLDYATSVVSIGKIQAAKARGEQVPADRIIDAEGVPTTDPDAFLGGGCLLPFGGYKGYALAVVAELLAIGLSGGDAFAGKERSSCLFVLAIDPGCFRRSDGLSGFVDATVARLKAARPADGEQILIPGEPEELARTSASRGVRLPPAVWHALCRTASDLDVPPPTPGEIEAESPATGNGR
ncbi:Ldh family oxidoreductase [Streptomyces sp. NPDC060053]|uniref:Ldh family oxidoreductase n=1 Tax=Streptomyces sp. NPDC060053 TaxID=3347047 RepID=UPI0036BAF89B